MSEEMAVSDNATGEDATVQSDSATVETVAEAAEELTEQPNEVPTELPEEPPVVPEEKPEPVKLEPDPEPEPHETETTNEVQIKDEVDETEVPLLMDIKDEFEATDNMEYPDDDDKRGIKRRASDAFDDDVEFKGFEKIEDFPQLEYSLILQRLEAEVKAASKGFRPLRTVMATPSAPVRATKRPRQDTDGSRSSSALSSRSEDDVNPSASPAQRGRRTTSEMTSPLFRVPIELGWKRELVYRAALDAHSRRNADIYYYTPYGMKLRSMREIGEHLSGTGLTLDNFTFFKEPLGLDDPEKEIIRDAKLVGGYRRVESPASPAAAAADGKRTPKPKQPKGVSPEPATPKSPPAKLKVKSVGSRLSGTPAAPAKKKATPAPASPALPSPAASPAPVTTPAATPATPDNNNTAAWKKPSDDKRRTRVANGAATPTPPMAAVSPRRRGRPRADAKDEVDYFSSFYERARDSNVVVQIFQYLGMRDLAHCARVCRVWRELSATPALWRHVRMKNSQVNDWGGLCGALKRHGTKWLDLRKMLLPQNDNAFWDQFKQHISKIDTLERLEMCRCPARAVEAAAGALPALRSLAALAIKDAELDPTPLAAPAQLRELRLKSMQGLALTADLTPLANLKHLQHLSLTSIKELGWKACDVVGELPNLESLELGECTFREEFGSVLGRLSRLKRLRLERGTAHCAAPALLRSLARLPNLTRLELVNIDVKVGFDDALAECKNIQRLLIIPTYVSQSATTNKQVLSGVLRLKETLTHLMWGVTIELLRVTELFIDQCSAGGAGGQAKRELGECIPVLKPVPGCRLPMDHQLVAGPPQVEILPLPTLQRLLSAQLPNTKLKLLRIPFHATWRQSLADFQ